MHRGRTGAAVTLALTAFGVVVVLTCAWKARALPPADAARLDWPTALLTIVPLGVAGAVLLDRRPDLPFGWLLAGGCLAHVLYATFSLPAQLAALRGDPGPLFRLGLAAGSLAFVQLPVQGLVNLRFPSGRPDSRRAHALEIAIVVGAALAVVGGVVRAASIRGTVPPAVAIAAFDGRVADGTTLGHIADALQTTAPLVVLLTLVAGLGVIVRFSRAEGIVRQQLKWRSAHVVLAIALFPLAVTTGLGPFDRLDNTLFVLTIAIPVLRYRLWAIDTVIRRSVAYALITLVLALGYIAVTLVVARFASERVGAFVAAIGAAAAFAPLRDRAQHLVDRIFYGQRSDPYRTLSELGRRLEAALSPGDVLVGIVEAVGESLRLPYAAIERAGDGSTLAVVGEPGPAVERWPLTYEGRAEGFLAASPRRGEDGFGDRDRELLADVARHAGVAVHAEALTVDLLQSRQRLVTALEEERRRLRRDLHDGLGPVLTGVGLNLDAARVRLASDPAAAERLLVAARNAAADAITDLRQVVYGLRPPALDDLGLVGALRAQAERLCAGTATNVTLEADELGALPAAVEVAAYRTAVEAITNALRHGQPRRCDIHLNVLRTGEFRLEVENDRAAGNGWVPGVGLTAMRERAEELGGSFSAGPIPDGGARVVATFPLPVDGR